MDEEQKLDMLKSAITQRIESVRTMIEFKELIKDYFQMDKLKPFLFEKLNKWEQNKENYKKTIDDQIKEIRALKKEI
jgi:predicted ribosome quality control (RQC) complex YloA/Tae2 family protein